uniref:mRNA-decapping enzyme 2 n=1 Tax=Plectus sambesii TaxID=2011161 RepID=A0A914WE26_9BILA
MAIPSDILDDICFRFLVNLPEDQKRDPIRVCFQAELAHWFYVDFYCRDLVKYPNCREVGMKEFIRVIFNHCDFLQPLAKKVEQIIEDWRAYKTSVPTFGAILLDSSLEHVLLVQGYYASKNNWGFPKGKVNEDEDPVKCAIREVLEETSYDISAGIKHQRFVQRIVGENPVQLYIIPDVPADFPFKPSTRYEIRKIQWFRLAELPSSRQDRQFESIGHSPNNFFTVFPFVDDIRMWAAKKNQHRAQQHQQTSAFRRVTPRSHKISPAVRNLFDSPQFHSPTPSLVVVGEPLWTAPAYPELPSTSSTPAPSQRQNQQTPKAKTKSQASSASASGPDVKTVNLAENIRLAKAWTNVKLDYSKGLIPISVKK